MKTDEGRDEGFDHMYTGLVSCYSPAVSTVWELWTGGSHKFLCFILSLTCTFTLGRGFLCIQQYTKAWLSMANQS